ncbi:group II intron maturase-specific domain-containing protein [Paraburkholderia unamae]|uniref:Group II intron maturase-specific domain-containing protein n=1 Tax=Paraburkholderia unamae TaxID=219649 RepID=A0ACC6RVE1_9BURK
MAWVCIDQHDEIISEAGILDVGTVFVSFLPAISQTAAKAIRQTVRRWRLHCRHTVELTDLAQEINPVLKGWLKYYGRFYRSALYAVFDSLDQYLVRWVRRKYKRLKDKVSRARELMVKIRHQQPGLFAHWILAQKTVGNRSRMNREIHVRFCEGLRVRFPWATHLNKMARTIWALLAHERKYQREFASKPTIA